MSTMIESERIQTLNGYARPAPGDYVLYWMQQSQREAHNPALEYAIREANRLETTVVVLFVLMEHYPDANERHFAFMLQGLREVAESLERRGVAFVVRRGEAVEAVQNVACAETPRCSSAIVATCETSGDGGRS